VTRDLATVADPGPFLNFNKGPDLDIIAYLTSVEIGEGKDLDPLT
jgi:hypothetical protein